MELFARLRRHSVILILPLSLLAGGCAHVKKEELDARLAELLSELERNDGESRTRDQALDGRLTTVEEDLDDLNSEVRSLAEEFDVTIQRLDSTLRFNMPVFFTFDSHELRPQDLPVLDRFGRVARDYYPDVKITVEGFTDPAGEASYNLELGRRRADAVRSYLVSQSAVDESRIRAVSYGEDVSRLLEADAQGPGDRGQANRRVVLVIDHAQGGE